MVPTTGGTGSGEPDMVLVSELLEDISRHPPAIGARKLLVEHYITVGWLDAAVEEVKKLQRDAPLDTEVQRFLTVLSKKPEPPADPSISRSKSRPAAPTSLPRTGSKFKRNSTKPATKFSGNLEDAKRDFKESYPTLRSKAKALFGNLSRLQTLQKKSGVLPSKNISKIQAIAEGRASDTVVVAGPPGSARSVARLIQATPEKATELAIADLEDMMNWVRELQGKDSKADDDAVSQALFKRMQAVELALPENLKQHPEIALMHVRHEHLGKVYVNEETMLGDKVKDIPRANFWVTEDNYAWDMEELAQAITSNGGVMRNPLSKQMFTPKDIRGIVNHRHGKALQALQVAQNEMAKGVRTETITQMDKLAKILLDDQSSDALPSRHAVDEFMAYIATLPEPEQKALDSLRCPAKDSHTGQPYDFSVGEAVRDAKGNLVCFHKTGDFIKQAAAYLRQNRGAPPDKDCTVM